MNTVTRLCILLLVTLLPLQAPRASGGGEKKELTPGAIYYNLYPPFVVNIFGEGKLRFLKADITLRFETGVDEEQLRHHLPLVRHELIMLLSSQNEESLTDLTKKEELRQKCLKKVQDVLTEKEGRHGVKDLLFQNFVVQR